MNFDIFLKKNSIKKGIAIVEFAVFIIPAFFLFYFLLDLTALYRYKNKIHQIAANIPIMTLAKIHKHESAISEAVLKNNLEDVSRDIFSSFDDNIKKLHNCYLYINWYYEVKSSNSEDNDDINTSFNKTLYCDQRQGGFKINNPVSSTFSLGEFNVTKTIPHIVAVIGVKADKPEFAWYDLSSWFKGLLPEQFSEKVIIEMPGNFSVYEDARN